MNGLRTFLQGKRTYVAVGAALVAIGVEKGLGIDVPGVMVGPNWMVDVAELAGLGFLRAGISNTLGK